MNELICSSVTNNKGNVRIPKVCYPIFVQNNKEIFAIQLLKCYINIECHTKEQKNKDIKGNNTNNVSSRTILFDVQIWDITIYLM